MCVAGKVDVIGLLIIRYTCVSTGKWDKSRNHFLFVCLFLWQQQTDAWVVADKKYFLTNHSQCKSRAAVLTMERCSGFPA